MDDATMRDDMTSTVKDGMKNGEHIGALPHMGTVDPGKSIESKTPAATNLEELHAEFKQYSLLRKKDQLETNLEAGTPAYVVPAKWLKKYHKFVCFEQFDDGVAPDQVNIDKATHFNEMHPGPITSRDDLCEEDKNGENVFGTGGLEGKGFEAEHLDTYIETKHTSQSGSFFIFN